MVFIVEDLSVVRIATGTLGIRSDRIFFAANGSVNKTLDKAIPSICVIYVHLEITYSDICKARLSPSNTLYSSLMNFNLFKNSVQYGTSIYLVRYPVPIPTGCKYRYRYKNKIKIPESIIYFFPEPEPINFCFQSRSRFFFLEPEPIDFFFRCRSRLKFNQLWNTGYQYLYGTGTGTYRYLPR